NFDSNYYAVPINDNLTITTKNSTTTTNRSLAMWQTFSGLDANSKKSPISITNVNQLFFAYDSLTTPTTVTLPAGNWIDITGALYSGSTTLQPYTSIVLLYNGSATPPTADAGVDQTITWPVNSVTLSGSGTAGSGSIVSYGWTKISGGTSTITNPNSQNTTVTGLDIGVYQFQLTVTNTSGATATDNVQITVNKGSASLSYTTTSVVFNNAPQSIGILTNP